jgi:uncharacterized membrane protein
VTKAIAGLALLGLAINIYLTYVHYAGIEPVCSSISNCERVQTSEYADLLGIPVAVLGIAGYGAILVSLRMRVDVTAMLAYLALAFSAYLTWAEVFKIEAICQWCVASAIITLVIAVLATLRALGAPLHHRALS